MNGSLTSHACLFQVVLVAFSAFGATHEQTETRDGVVAHLRVEVEPPRPAGPGGKVEVGLSGELVLTLRVDAPAGVAIGPLPEITASKAWRQRDPAKGWDTAELEGGLVRRRQTYRLSPWQLGEVSLPLLPVKYRKDRSQEEWEEIAWKPIPVLVSTIIREPDLRGARDITGIEELPTPEQGPGGGLLGTGVAALALTMAGWLAWRRRADAGPPPSPHEWALVELARLDEWIPSSTAEMERFHTLLSGILRQYLERRFDLHAPRQTTPEFLDAARQSPQLTTDQRALLRDLLERCDLAKFARTHPNPEECRGEVARARAFVEESRPLVADRPA